MKWNRLLIIWVFTPMVFGCSMNNEMEQGRYGAANLEVQNTGMDKANVTLCISYPGKRCMGASSSKSLSSSASQAPSSSAPNNSSVKSASSSSISLSSSSSSSTDNGWLNVTETEITNVVIQMKEPSGNVVSVNWDSISMSNVVFPDRPFGTNELTIYETDTTPLTYMTRTNLVIKQGCDYFISITLGGNLVIVIDSSSSSSSLSSSRSSSSSSSSSSLFVSSSRSASSTSSSSIKSSSSLSSSSSSSSQAPVCLKVKYFNASLCQYVRDIYPWYEVINTGCASIDLTKLKLRYYFTADGIKSPGFICDYSGVWNKCAALQDRTKSVSGTLQAFQSSAKSVERCSSEQYVKPDTYLEISFNASAGKLDPGCYLFVLARIHSPNGSYFNQANDYSFNPNYWDYNDWSNVTAYYNGILVSGNEPQ